MSANAGSDQWSVLWQKGWTQTPLSIHEQQGGWDKRSNDAVCLLVAALAAPL